MAQPDDRTKAPDSYGKRELDWVRCAKHGIDYPKNGRCPACEAERLKR